LETGHEQNIHNQKLEEKCEMEDYLEKNGEMNLMIERGGRHPINKKTCS